MNLLVIFVIAILLLQVGIFAKTFKLIHNLRKVLSGEFVTGRNEQEDVTVIRYRVEDKDKISKNIEDSINTYLGKNKGAVSDFNLIKDIVERNCDTLEAEIASQTPLPLYLGLMGTVAGIILGLFAITVSGGFSNIEKVIEILMSDVAIAMIASFAGIGFTTLTLWMSKRCKVVLESNKNHFYTWIQTNLLPVISRSAVSAITLLQQNLTRFNESFTGTVDRLEEKLGDVGDVYESQLEILEKIEAIDVNKMASANVRILAALDGTLGDLKSFSQYIGNVTEYLTAVRDLNGKLDEHLERTETLAVVSDFYRKQMKEIGLRQDAIRSAVLSVDDVMKSALASLRSNSEEGLRSMQEAFVGQMMAMQEMISRQTEALGKQMNQMPQIVQKFEEISAIPSKIEKLIERIEKSNAKLLNQVSSYSLQRADTDGNWEITAFEAQETAQIGSPWLKRAVAGLLVVLSIVSIANLNVNIRSLEALKEEHTRSEQFEAIKNLYRESNSILEDINKKLMPKDTLRHAPDSAAYSVSDSIISM